MLFRLLGLHRLSLKAEDWLNTRNKKNISSSRNSQSNGIRITTTSNYDGDNNNDKRSNKNTILSKKYQTLNLKSLYGPHVFRDLVFMQDSGSGAFVASIYGPQIWFKI